MICETCETAVNLRESAVNLREFSELASESSSNLAMGSLIQRVVFNSEKTWKTHTTTYESDGSRLGGWTILNGPAQKTARFHLFFNQKRVYI